MDAMKAAGISYGVDGDVILISFDACTAGLEYVMSGDINADFECNPLAAPFVEDVIQQLESDNRTNIIAGTEKKLLHRQGICNGGGRLVSPNFKERVE